MSMKSKASLLGLLAFAIAMDPYSQTEHKNYEPKKVEPHTPFNKQENILRMIKSYKQIEAGTSSLSPRKQRRIVEKLLNWTEEGKLTKKDFV